MCCWLNANRYVHFYYVRKGNNFAITKISTSVHVRGWAIYDLGKRFNIAIHLLNLQSRNFILNIRIRKFKLYLSVRHPVLKSLSGDWTDVIINTLCYQFLILFLFERPLSERRKDGFPNCMGPGKCSSFPFFQFCFLSNHNGPDLIVPLFKAFTSQISFSSSWGICFWQHVKIVFALLSQAVYCLTIGLS